MLIHETKLRAIIREEIAAMNEADAPADPFGRAGKRFMDAVDRKSLAPQRQEVSPSGWPTT